MTVCRNRRRQTRQDEASYIVRREQSLHSGFLVITVRGLRERAEFAADPSGKVVFGPLRRRSRPWELREWAT